MSAKKLELGSEFETLDVDGDGVVSDQELRMRKEFVRLENEDRMADQQRLMAWASMVFVMAVVAVQYTPLVSLDRIEATLGFVNTVVLGQLGIVVSFMGFSALQKKNGNGASK
jgi:hypothetical protein